MVKFLLLSVALAFSAALEASSVCRYTGGGENPKWSVKENWEDGAIPGSGADVVVSARADSAAIEVDGDYAIASLTIEGDSAVDLTGDGSLSLSGNFTAKTKVVVGAGLALSFSGATTYVNAVFEPANSSATAVFNCPVALQEGVGKFYTRGKGAISFNNTFTGANAVIGPATGTAWSPNGIVEFNGSVKVKSVIFKSHQSQSEYIFNATGNEWALTEVSYGAISFGSENACPPSAVLSWNAWAREITAPNYCSYCFKGFDQTVDRLTGEAAATYDSHFINPNTYWAENGKKSVLTLKGSDSARTDVKLVGKLSLVWAPEEDYTQEFVKRDHTMSGFLCVSNGTLRISEGASFVNVGGLVVGGDGVLEIDTAAETAFTGVTNVFVSAAGTLVVGESTPSPFSPGKAVLQLERGAKIVLPQGRACTFKSVSIDGIQVAAWSYTGEEGSAGSRCDWIDGGGLVQVLEGEGGSATWIGGGDEKTTTAGNWLDGRAPNAGDEITVAAAGGRMLLAKDIDVSALTFVAGQAREFTVANDVSDTVGSLGIGGGGIEFSGGVAQTNNLACPVSLVSQSQTWTLGGVGSLLRIGGTVSGIVAPASVSVLAAGGSCEIGGLLDYGGSFTFKDGKLYAGGSSFGPDLSVRVEGNDRNTEVFFTGGEYVAPVCVAKKNTSGWSSTDVRFPPNSTNEFSKVFSVEDGWHTIRIIMENAASAVFKGGLSKNNGESLFVMFNGFSSTVEFREKPLSGVCGNGMTLLAWSRSHEIRFSAADNSLSGPLTICGPTVRTMCEWAFSTNTAMMPLSMKVRDNASGGVFDLNGFDQAVGRLVGGDGHDASATVRSDLPAVLHVYQEAGGAATEFAPAFAGAVSLCKHGADPLALSGVSSTTGALQVAQGVLSFAGAGSWTGASEIVLEGGELAVDADCRLPGETSYRLLGGKLNIASGVCLKSRSVTVADGAGGTMTLDVGVYTKQNLPAHIDGDGSLQVKGDGLTILVR